MNHVLNISFVLFIFLLTLKKDFIWAQNRIIGGNEAKIEDFPYMLRLIIPRKFSLRANLCGAGIISKEWAVTAAHCFMNKKMDVKRIRVTAGTADLKNKAKTAKKYRVIKYIQHELFTGINSNKSIEGDIAVIQIHPPLKYNKATKPLKLPEKGVLIKKSWATIAGWGKTNSSGKGTKRLRYVKLPRVATKKCKKQYNENKIRFHVGEICYGFHNSTVTEDKCQGDSGGPLVNDDNIVLGVVSKGVKCGERGLPGIYSDMIYYRDWIRNKTGV